MADQQENNDEPQPRSQAVAAVAAGTDMSPEAVVENLGSAYWWVDECEWSAVQPDLPDDLTLLLAPPILVGAAPVAAASRPSST